MGGTQRQVVHACDPAVAQACAVSGCVMPKCAAQTQRHVLGGHGETCCSRAACKAAALHRLPVHVDADGAEAWRGCCHWGLLLVAMCQQRTACSLLVLVPTYGYIRCGDRRVAGRGADEHTSCCCIIACYLRPTHFRNIQDTASGGHTATAQQQESSQQQTVAAGGGGNSSSSNTATAAAPSPA